MILILGDDEYSATSHAFLSMISRAFLKISSLQSFSRGLQFATWLLFFLLANGSSLVFNLCLREKPQHRLLLRRVAWGRSLLLGKPFRYTSRSLRAAWWTWQLYNQWHRMRSHTGERVPSSLFYVTWPWIGWDRGLICLPRRRFLCILGSKMPLAVRWLLKTALTFPWMGEPLLWSSFD